MLTLFDGQLEAFAQAELSMFEDEMIQHCEDFLPSIAESLSEEQRREVVTAALLGAERHGLSSDGPMRLFVEYSVIFGCQFDSDVQLPWAKEWLGKPDLETEMHRAEDLYEAGDEFIDEVHGPQDSYLEEAYECLFDFVSAPLESIQLEEVPAVALEYMEDIYPEKFAKVGQKALSRLISSGVSMAANYGLSTPDGTLLLVLLMFTLGQGCVVDPTYPWIADCLDKRSEITSANDVGQRLRETTRRWLDMEDDVDERPSV